MHSGEDKVECSRYRHNPGLNDGTPRPSSAFGLTRRKTSPSHLHTSNNKRPAVTQFRGGVRESATAVPRILPSVNQTSYLTDKQEYFTHDEDDLQQMNVVKALKDEIRDLKQLLHNSNQQINKMKVREKEIKEYSKDQIFELEQKNSELQKQQQEREQPEALLRRTLEESSEIIEIKKNEQKLHEILSKAMHLSETEKMKNRQLLSEISQLNKDKHDLQEQAVNIEPTVKQLITENEKLKTTNENLEKVAVEMGSRFDSIKSNYNREKAELEESRTRLREISEDNQSKDKQVFELRTKLEYTEKKFQEAHKNDDQRIQDLETETSKLASWHHTELSSYKQLIADLEKRVQELSKENLTLKELSKESKKRYSDEIESLKYRLQKTETELEEHKTRNQDIERDLTDLKSRLTDTQKELLQTKNNKEQTERTLEKRNQDDIERYEKEISSYRQNLSDLNSRIEKLTKENKKLEDDKKTLQVQIDHRENELKKKKTELSNLNTRYSEERSNTKHEIDDLKSKLVDTEAKMKKDKQERLDLENEKQSRGKEIAQLQRTITSLEQQIEQLLQENKNIKMDIDQQMHSHENKPSDASESRDTKTRLSKCMGGDELTNNNPNIVYLSDMNRPSKLSERYMELYDNQWTDAYELLEKSAGAEEQIIKILLETLIATKRFCDHHTEMEMDHILKVITRKDRWQQSEVPVSVIQYIKDRRKSTAAETMKTKYKEYVDDLRKNQLAFVKHALRIDAYLQECFEVCWLMAIQDPPVVFAPAVEHGDPFNADLYSAYTVTGKIVDYVVWPALLLHTNGPTLTKGVAQGMKKR